MGGYYLSKCYRSTVWRCELD